MLQLIYFGHMKRIDKKKKKRFPKIAYGFQSKTKENKGRPRKTWEEEINMSLEESGLS